MDAMDKAVRTCGLQYAVADWWVMAPVHYWSGTRAYKAKGGLSDAGARTQRSLCVVNFVQSGKSWDDDPEKMRHASSKWWEEGSCWDTCVRLSREAWVHQPSVAEAATASTASGSALFACKPEAPTREGSPVALPAPCQPPPVKKELAAPASHAQESAAKRFRLGADAHSWAGAPGLPPAAELVESMLDFWRLCAKGAACQTLYHDLPVEWQATLHGAGVEGLPPASTAVGKLLEQGCARRRMQACARAFCIIIDAH